MGDSRIGIAAIQEWFRVRSPSGNEFEERGYGPVDAWKTARARAPEAGMWIVTVGDADEEHWCSDVEVLADIGRKTPEQGRAHGKYMPVLHR